MKWLPLLSFAAGAFVVAPFFPVQAQTTILPPPVDAPILCPPSGTSDHAIAVSITDATPGATIYYRVTVNGGSASSVREYQGPIIVDTVGTTEITATAAAPGLTESPAASGTFVIVPTGQ